MFPTYTSSSFKSAFAYLNMQYKFEVDKHSETIDKVKLSTTRS